MDNFDIAIKLLIQAQEEKKAIENFDAEYKAALALDRENGGATWTERNKVFERYPRTPKKSVVNDNIKIARRLLLDEYM